MKKPVIGLTPSHDTAKDDLTMRPTYLRAIKAAGGIPVILPLEISGDELLQLTALMDGVLFTGGPDVHPFYFDQQTQAHCGNVSLKRDRMELELLTAVMAAQKPILGICRGIQIINIGLGGDIYQDLPSQFPEDFPVAHQQPFDYTIPAHTVDVVKGTLLHSITGTDSLKVNSMHHQAVRHIAPGLVVSGYAPNQLAESLEKPDYPYLVAVQWHPEYLWSGDPAAMKLFQSFVDACR